MDLEDVILAVPDEHVIKKIFLPEIMSPPKDNHRTSTRELEIEVSSMSNLANTTYILNYPLKLQKEASEHSKLHPEDQLQNRRLHQNEEEEDHANIRSKIHHVHSKILKTLEKKIIPCTQFKLKEHLVDKRIRSKLRRVHHEIQILSVHCQLQEEII